MDFPAESGQFYWQKTLVPHPGRGRIFLGNIGQGVVISLGEGVKGAFSHRKWTVLLAEDFLILDKVTYFL